MDPKSTSPDPRRERRLVAVFPDQSRADAAEASLRSQGVGTVIVGDPEDHVATLAVRSRGSQPRHRLVLAAGDQDRRSELAATRHGAMSGRCSPCRGRSSTKDAMVGAHLIMVAMIEFLGFVIALVLGPGMGVNRPAEQMAAERGVTLQVLPSTSAASEALAALHPIRIDEVGADGTPIAVVDPGEGEGDGAPVTGLVANLGTDDYAPPTPPSTDPDRQSTVKT